MFAIGDFGWTASEWATPTAITGGATKGSTSITVASTAGLSVGVLMWVEQANDGTIVFGYGCGGTGNPTSNSSAGSRLHDDTANLNQRVMVTGISGNTVTFSPPLNFPFNQSLSPQAIGFGSKHGATRAGLEDLTVNGASAGMGIWFMGCYACWLKNIELTGWGTFGIEMQDSANCEVRESYVHEPADYNWSRGYPYQFDAANNCLTENNIFWHFQADLIIQGCSSGNVFGYNCVFQAYNVYNGISIMLDAYSGNHTPYPIMNLWEGNYGNEFHSDFYYGPSSAATLVRNYLTGSDPDILQNRVVINLDAHQWSNSIVGNVLGSSGVSAPVSPAMAKTTISYANSTPLTWTLDPGTRSFSYSENVIYRLGYPFMGNNGTGSGLAVMDPVVRSSTLIHGNWDYSTKSVAWDPTISDHNVPNSYYLSGKPSWFGDRPWPPYDASTATTASMTNIPAGYRFFFGHNPPAGNGNQPPTAVAAATPVRGTAPLAVSFSSAGSSDPEGATLTFVWTFGDGTTSTAANPSHTYQTAGTYSASVAVSDGANTVTSSSVTITATPAGQNLPPVPVVAATPVSGVAPLAVTFSSAGSSDPEGSTLTYNWAFGDGTTSTAANPAHTYAAIGNYTARLTVSDGTNSVPTNIVITVISHSTGLVAAYGFEDGTGSVVTDSSTQGNGGAITAATWTGGKFGNQRGRHHP
jgi:PKD repeat protein